ncbi:MAG: hypothetical protein C0404_11930 [Verrucomicrobia bacterium]|nr:hypothetical protein [Verrucomicrobiota bacterium]
MSTKPKQTVLCVDDEASILEVLRKLLERENFKVLSATGGKDALRIMAEEAVDLVISDQRMPEMDGTTLLSHIRTKYPHVLRIMMSGYSDFDSLVAAVNEGEIFRFIAKPWQRENLIQVINAALNQREVISRIESVVRNVCSMMELAEKTSIETHPEFQALTVKIGEPEDAFPKEVIMNFLQLLMKSLGMKAEDAWTGTGTISKKGFSVSITIDIGRGVQLKLIVPRLKK